MLQTRENTLAQIPAQIEDDTQPGWKASAFAAIGCVSITGMSFGLGLPLLAFNLEFMTGLGIIIGLHALMGALSIILIAPFAPAILSRVPTRPFLILCLGYVAFTFIAYRLFPYVPVWMFLRFTSGVAVAIIFVASETWIIQLAPKKMRGRVLGIYSMALGLGFGLGGLTVALLGVRGWPPFLVGGALCLIAILPLLLPGPELHTTKSAANSVRALMTIMLKTPRIMVAALVFGAIETSAMHFAPIWAYRVGYAETNAQYLIAAGAFGVILLQLPISWLGDYLDRYRLMLACAAIGVIAPVLLYFAGLNLSSSVYVIFFLYVGTIEGLYVLAMALIGQKFDRAEMTSANAALVTMYGIGALLGPTVIGPLMDIINPAGTLLGLLLIGMIYPVTALLRSLQQQG